MRQYWGGASLVMHPSVACRFHARGYVKKGRGLLSNAPFGRFPEALASRRPSVRGEIFLSFLIKSFIRNAHFGRSLAQLILAALSLYPFEVKEGPAQRILSDVPSGRYS